MYFMVYSSNDDYETNDIIWHYALLCCMSVCLRHILIGIQQSFSSQRVPHCYWWYLSVIQTLSEKVQDTPQKNIALKYFRKVPVDQGMISQNWCWRNPMFTGFNPSEKYESQLGWWHSQYMESQNPVMFQITNQITIIFPLLLVYSLLTIY